MTQTTAGLGMRAVVHERYGPPEVLRVVEVERPEPKQDEVLVRVRATTVNRTDAGLRSAEVALSRVVTGLRRPKQRILGLEFAGVVEETGAAVTEFQVGDEVFGVRSGRCRVRRRTGERLDRAQARRDELRGGRGGLRRSGPGARMPEEGRPAAGTERARLRRVRLGRDHGRPARQALRRRASRRCATRKTSS